MKIKQLFTIALLLIITGLGARQITITEFESLIWRFSNIERVKNGLPALLYDDGLASLSRLHSKNMLNLRFFDHKDDKGNYVNERKMLYYPELVVSSIGENLARFYNTDEIFTPEEIVTGWMNSPLHRENILNDNFTHMGVGVVNHKGFLLATQTFANALVKRTTPLPKKIKHSKKLKLVFEYMSPIEPEKLMASLKVPNGELRFQVAKNAFTVGSMPAQLNWIDAKHFYVELYFPCGKGDYELSFGYGGGFYEQGVLLKVK